MAWAEAEGSVPTEEMLHSNRQANLEEKRLMLQTDLRDLRASLGSGCRDRSELRSAG